MVRRPFSLVILAVNSSFLPRTCTLLLFAQAQQIGKMWTVALQLYELRKRGFVNVRSVLATTPMEDFCFLMSTKFHLSGLKMSTFASWAVLLSNATKQRFHTVKSSYDKQVVRWHCRHWWLCVPVTYLLNLKLFNQFDDNRSWRQGRRHIL
jgi:hypothetical protein